MRQTKEVIYDHLQKRDKGDVEGDIKTNYSPDVVILSSKGTFFGHDGVRQSADVLDRDISDAEFKYDEVKTEGDYALLVWSAENGTEFIENGTDSFAVKKGLIVMQTVNYEVKDKP